jgi:hypothetical protein
MTLINASRRAFDQFSLSDIFNIGGVVAFWNGLMSGYKAYQLYTDLDGQSDAQLKANGVSRVDLPRIAMQKISNTKNF